MRRFFPLLTLSLLALSTAGWYLLAVAIPRAAVGDVAPRWGYPLAGAPQVLRRFDPPGTPWGSGHRGVDLAARPGQPVLAAGPGQVGYAGVVAGRGVVTVVHGGLRTTYLPVDSSVRVGERVEVGDRLGTVEDRVVHCAPDHCLHWGLLRGSEYLDPLALVGVGEVRLLPYWEMPTPPALDAGGPPPADARDSGPRTGARPARAPAAGTGSGADETELSLAGSMAVGSGSAILTGLVVALGMLLARRRARRPSPLPNGVIDLIREREARRPRASPPYDPGDRPPS